MPRIILTSKPLCLEVGVEALQVSQRVALARPPGLVGFILGLNVEELVDELPLAPVAPYGLLPLPLLLLL